MYGFLGMGDFLQICKDASDTELTPAELQNVANKLCRAITPIQESDHSGETELVASEDREYLFQQFLQHLYASARIHEQAYEVERSFKKSDFSINEPLLLEVFKILTIFQMYFASDECILNVKDKGAFTTVALTLIHQHMSADKLWTTHSVHNAAQILLAKILQLHKVEQLGHLLKTCLGENHCVFRCITDMLKPQLTKETWKKNPPTMHCFVLILLELKSPEVSDCLPQIFPPILLLVDDFEVQHKVMGIKCANHVINNTSKSELTWYGRADVLYSALYHNLHSSDENIIAPLLPCLLSLAQAIDSNSANNEMPLTYSKLDDVFQILLTNMDFESKWCNRRVYAKNLSAFIEVLGIEVVKHMQRTLKVIENYIEVADYPNEQTRLDTTVALCSLIKVAWPRIPQYLCKIMQFLLKVVIDMSDHEAMVSGESRDQLISSIKEVVSLLSGIDKVKTVQILNASREVETLPNHTKKIISDIRLSLKD